MTLGHISLRTMSITTGQTQRPMPSIHNQNTVVINSVDEIGAIEDEISVCVES